ncbi:MAG TPA: hydrolase, partial [Longimicrobiales bacterium]|nr:hydrolase [Longimicrobiales bacterium]
MNGKVGRDGFDVRPFRPARLLRNAHAQTIGGRFLRRAEPPLFERERIDLPDGDFVDLDHVIASTLTDDSPVVLLMHGLEGSARRGYAINTYRELARRGVRAVGLNFRSCSGEPNRNARFYHSGDTADIEHVLRLLAERYPDVPRGAIGFSLGGNAMLKLLGELGEDAASLVSAAVAVSVPYDLGAGADWLDRSRFGRIYTSRFIASLIAKAETKATQLGDTCDLDRIRAARSFREFDGAATAPIHGFADADDYYTRSSSIHYLHAIRVPTLLLHAADDPFLPAECFPHEQVTQNPWLEAVVTDAGGHVGFIEGTPWKPRFWAEEEAAGFLARVLRQHIRRGTHSAEWPRAPCRCPASPLLSAGSDQLSSRCGPTGAWLTRAVPPGRANDST